ncbi:MAG: peptidase [Gemmatimonadetes bacterium]|nr:peptidase [Gemmatimonadota bacterium]
MTVRLIAVLGIALASASPAFAQTRLTTPKDFFGFNIGDDYQLANYQKMTAYWKKLATESDRIVVQDIGKTAEGRSHLMAIVSSPANMRNLARYRGISKQLALAEGLTDDQARALAREGKSIVWIDGGLHANEVLGAQQLTEMIWQMVSRTDEETMRMLNDDIILFVHANPDGNDLTADWYNRNPVPERRTNAPGLPRLYQKYIGHDNNRDFFGSTQPETENMNRVMYHDWFPQIVYNHHQAGPAGTVMFAPPFRDPFNFNFDPLVVVELDLVAAAMHSRFESEGKPGVTMRSGSSYSTWWNGGLRTTAYFHNMIGILTETIGNPTPMRIPYVPRQVLPRADLPSPIRPQEWHFRQSIDYSVTANRAILDIASRNRENFLFNIYRMGRNSIDRGNRDSWTVTPRRVAKANEEFAKADPRGGAAGTFDPYAAVLNAPHLRDPRGYVIPSDQPDFLTAIKFVNSLREVNVTVHRATASFPAGGKTYPAGSFVVMSAQAFRPHVLDMFEPQDHPDDFPYPGAAPTPPYDNAGWTLAFEMGVQFDRILEGFTGPFEKVTEWNVAVPAGKVVSVPRAAGYLTDRRVNDAARATNRLLAAKESVQWLTAPVTVGAKTYPAGTLYIPAKATTATQLAAVSAATGVTFEGTPSRPAVGSLTLKVPRIGLMDVYGGSMTSGWTRWILEQFDFPYTRVFAPEIDRGNLNATYDVLVFPNGVLPDPNSARGGFGGGDQALGGGAPAVATAAIRDSIEASFAPEYRGQRGPVTDTTRAAIKAFVENGGTVLAIGGSSAAVAAALGLPVTNHLVENGQPIPRTKFYVPGSVLTAQVDNASPLAAGLGAQSDVFYDNSPVFSLGADAAAKGVKRVAWFNTKTPLKSGWAWGQSYLDGGSAILEATVGRGRAYLFGPEILQRGQTHGTFKFFFNGIFYGPAVAQKPTT